MSNGSRLDPQAVCPASGLTNAACMATICDCFPDEPDRFGLHPERFRVVGVKNDDNDESDKGER